MHLKKPYFNSILIYNFKYQSTCDGKTHNCIAFGPGRTMVESTKIIAERQYEKAMVIFFGLILKKFHKFS